MLGLRQSDFAAQAGSTRKSQFNYETDARRPDADYLAAIAALGVDVLYVLTGQRSKPLPPTAELPPRVRALVANYEATSEEGRRHIESAASLASQSVPTKKGKAV